MNFSSTMRKIQKKTYLKMVGTRLSQWCRENNWPNNIKRAQVAAERKALANSPGDKINDPILIPSKF